VTGASGWIGKETSELLLRTLGGEFRNRVTLVTSDGRDVFLQSGAVSTISWNSFVACGKFDLILHFAFLNQDKIGTVGKNKFLEINRQITADVLHVSSRNPANDILCASSGAAISYSSNVNSDAPYEVYAGIKNEMESLFKRSGVFENLILMRIWSISGIYMDLDAPYALASFVSQGLRAETIEVKGPVDSLRTFINAQEMIWVYIMSLGWIDYQVLDSGGFTINMFDLAALVSTSLGGGKVISKLGPSSALANYTPDASVFNALAKEFSLELSGVSDQVTLISKFHSKSL